MEPPWTSRVGDERQLRLGGVAETLPEIPSNSRQFGVRALRGRSDATRQMGVEHLLKDVESLKHFDGM